jgi:hypothetical protein
MPTTPSAIALLASSQYSNALALKGKSQNVKVDEQPTPCFIIETQKMKEIIFSLMDKLKEQSL